MAASSRRPYKRLPLVTSSQQEQVGRLRADAQACRAAAVAAVSPAALVARALSVTAEGLTLRDRAGALVATHAGPVLLVGGGKAAIAMARQVASALETRVTGGVIIVPHGGTGEVAESILVRSGAHPLPDGAGVAATARLIAAVEGASAASALGARRRRLLPLRRHAAHVSADRR